MTDARFHCTGSASSSASSMNRNRRKLGDCGVSRRPTQARKLCDATTRHDPCDWNGLLRRVLLTLLLILAAQSEGSDQGTAMPCRACDSRDMSRPCPQTADGFHV